MSIPATSTGHPGWQRTLWIVFVVQLISATGFGVMFPFLTLYVAELGTNTSLPLTFWAAMAFSGQALAMAIASPFWGAIGDRFGHRRMLERATLGGALILLAMGFARNAEELVFLRVVQGIVTGTIAAVNALVAVIAPREKLGYALGVAQLGLYLGIAFGPVIGGIIADLVGYRATYAVTAALLLGAGLLVRFGVPAVRSTAKKQRGAGDPRVLLAAPGVVAVYGVRFLAQVGQAMLLPILPLLVVELLHTGRGINSATGLLIGVSAAAATITAVALGRLGDRIGHRRVLIGAAFVAGLAFLPQTLVTEFWQLLALTVISGAATGGIVPALGALLVRLTPPGTEGATYGIDNSVSSAGRAVAPLIAVAIVEVASTRAVIGLNSVLFIGAALLALLVVPVPTPETGG